MSAEPPIQLPANKRRGDPIKADDFNLVLDVLRMVAGIRVGQGLTLLRTSSGFVVGRSDGRGGGPEAVEILDALIEAVTVNADGSTPFLPSDVRYTARVIGRPDIEPLVGVAPVYGRPTQNDEFAVYPSRPGELCRIVVRPAPDNLGGRVAELWVLSERLAGGCPDPA